ncbi:MAG TPA: DUF1223 domain-containing protein [Terriglobia bacterium]
MSRYPLWLLIIFTLALAAGRYTGKPAGAAAPLTRTPVLVELFTSEGCSDCPPADQVLAQLAERNLADGAEVIAMSEHVDYWNRLGWSDPFSDAQFSARQNEYAQAFGHRDIYTPQMVVDGQSEFVGSNQAQAIQAITRAGQRPKGSVALTQIGRDKDTVKVQVSVSQLSQSASADVFLALTENNLYSNVERGENRGRKLAHTAVVRKLTPIGRISGGGSFTGTSLVRVARQWKSKDLRAVAFVQEKANRHILAVSSIAIETQE